MGGGSMCPSFSSFFSVFSPYFLFSSYRLSFSTPFPLFHTFFLFSPLFPPPTLSLCPPSFIPHCPPLFNEPQAY